MKSVARPQHRLFVLHTRTASRRGNVFVRNCHHQMHGQQIGPSRFRRMFWTAALVGSVGLGTYYFLNRRVVETEVETRGNWGKYDEKSKRNDEDNYFISQDTIELAAGYKDKTFGAAKEGFGTMIGSDTMAKDGAAQREKGNMTVDKLSSKEEEMKGKKDSIVGSAKNKTGKAIGNKKLQREGELQKEKGDLKSQKSAMDKTQQNGESSYLANVTTGYTDKFVGSAKESVGHLVGSKKMETAGVAQREKGEAELGATLRDEKDVKDRVQKETKKVEDKLEEIDDKKKKKKKNKKGKSKKNGKNKSKKAKDKAESEWEKLRKMIDRDTLKRIIADQEKKMEDQDEKFLLL